MKNHNAGTIQGIALILPVTLVVMGAVLLAPIMPKLMQTFGHIDNAKILVPILIAIPALCIAIFAPIAGILADKIGRRRLLIVSMGVYACFGMLPLVIDTYWPLLVTRIGVGICEAILITCSTALIGDHFAGAQRDKWLGSQAALSTFSAMILFPISGALGAKFGWQGPFAIYGIALVMMLGIIFLVKEVPPSSNDSPQEDNMSFPWHHMLKVCTFTLLGGIMFYVLQFQMGNALATFDIDDPAKTGMFLSFSSLGIIIGAVLFRFVNGKLAIKKLVMLEFTLIAIGFFGMSLAASPEILVATGFVNQLGAGLMLPTLITWAVSPLKYTFRGKGTGIWQSTFAIGQFSSSLSFALVLGVIGQTAAGKDDVLGAFQIYGAVALLVILLAFIFIKER